MMMMIIKKTEFCQCETELRTEREGCDESCHTSIYSYMKLDEVRRRSSLCTPVWGYIIFLL